MKGPLVSVVMPVYNSEKYLKLAIDSVLKQKLNDFEFIIIDDGSMDKSLKIIKTYKDKRIKLIINQKNLGVSKSLNIGLKNSAGKYIARVDADDLNDKTRFFKQVIFLDEHKDYVLVGSNAMLINDKGDKLGETLTFESDKKIRKEMIFRNQMIHSSVMFKREEALKVGFYRDIFNGAEDYDLWFRLLDKGKFYNIQENLLEKRLHDKAVTKNRRLKVEIVALLVRIVNLC